MRTKIILYLTLFLIAVGMYGCSKSSSTLSVGNNGDNSGNTTTSPGANEVWMQNRSFVPATKTIAVGTTIIWTNKDADTHDVKSSTGIFTSPSMGLNATYSYTFAAAGTYNYSCVFHAGMNGTIIVQ